MDTKQLLETIHLLEKLKNTLRHCHNSNGQVETVAEHSWRIATIALFLKGSIENLDINKVVTMCLIHDLGEIFTGDIPVFLKTEAHEEKEDMLLKQYLHTLPEDLASSFIELFDEMNALETLEAKVFKALDSMEAVISHNEASIDTWEDHEYELQKNHGYDKVAFHDYLKELRDLVLEETMQKIEEAN